MKLETIPYRKKPQGKNTCIKFKCEAVVRTPEVIRSRPRGDGYTCPYGALFTVNGVRMCRTHAASVVLDNLIANPDARAA